MWAIDRRDQVVELQTLLRLCESLNSGSGVIEKMQKIGEIATALKRIDIRKNRESFMQFLIAEATQGNFDV